MKRGDMIIKPVEDAVAGLSRCLRSLGYEFTRHNSKISGASAYLIITAPEVFRIRISNHAPKKRSRRIYPQPRYQVFVGQRSGLRWWELACQLATLRGLPPPEEAIAQAIATKRAA